ncbi:MAG: dihydrodipicolinate synthase family protein [Kiritimatiellae bacterium]|nr:dihydrodipicolinate synthase family protein [Kiritimatiellia bacterium]
MSNVLKNGAYVALLTPFKNGEVNYGEMRRHLNFLLARGSDGVCPCGTTGEFLALALEEKKRIFKTVADVCRDRVSILCGIGAAGTEEIVAAGQYAEEIGADALLLTSPFYYKYRQEEIFRFYRGIKRRCRLPLLCYNIPQFAGNEITPETYTRLCAEGIVAGMKNSTGNRDGIVAMLRQGGVGKLLFTGNDAFALESRQLGTSGVISAIGNVFPELFARIWQLRDQRAQALVNQLRDAVLKVGFIAGLKQCLVHLGFAYGESRMPFMAPEHDRTEELKAIVNNIAKELKS